MNNSSEEKEHVTQSVMSLRDFISQLKTNNENNEAELPFYRTMFENLIEKAPVGIYILEDGAYSYVNTYYAALLGYTKEELTQGKVSLDKTIHPDDFPVIQRNIEKRKQGEKKEDRYRIRKFNKDGRLIYTEIHTTVAEMYGKTALFGSLVDITEQVVTQQQLEESSEQYKSLFDSSPDAIYSIDEEGVLINANLASELLIGYSNDEALGMSFMPLIAPEDLPKAIKHFEDAKKEYQVVLSLFLYEKMERGHI
jgi:PAS domain S-box-containing protein